MKGILYGIGTGPGESLLMTKKAIEIIKGCDVIALPSAVKENCAAYKTVKGILPEIDSKEFLFLDFPMTKDDAVLESAHKSSAEKIQLELDKNKNIAFITIGDVTVYSTFTYIKKILNENDYETILINGIPSFCAVAARLGISLSGQDEEIHILPANYSVKDSFSLNGTLVFMKSGNKLLELKSFLLEKKKVYNFDFYAVSNCGMDNEKIISSFHDLTETESYFTTVIIKNKRKISSEKNYSFFQNTKCENFPCHKIGGTDGTENFNCLFCYCPLYYLGDRCGGNFKYTDKGVKSCIDCNFPHKKENYELVRDKLKNMNP